MRTLFSFLLLLSTAQTWSQTTVFERSNGDQTATYHETIAFYKSLAATSPNIKVTTQGPTDAGFPLHLVLVSGDGNTKITEWQKQHRTIILINNGIHPGEPDGIDASQLLVRDIAAGKLQLPSNLALAIIPIYNIGGSLNRSNNYRVDQNGPAAFGSRGNSQNLDLNRDFIKADSKEARSFAQIFQLLQPQIFIDNHVSNGADYQHTMTLLSTQHNKLGGAAGQFLHNVIEPKLFAGMQAKGHAMIPYVNHYGETPDKGWSAYFDGPRYSSGYAALWQCLAFVPETHMLKSYPARVKATYDLLCTFLIVAQQNHTAIQSTFIAAKKEIAAATSLPVDWQLIEKKADSIYFMGYQSGKKNSSISGQPRLYYDRERPYAKTIPFYNYFETAKSINVPKAYIIPQGWHNVIDRLKDNQIAMKPLMQDTVITVKAYKILDYKTANRPYEKHYIHSQVKVEVQEQKIAFRKGDWWIPLQQNGKRFLVEVLEPEAPDSYFAWNFFDAILAQKEGYSNYVFEDIAAEWLKQHPEVEKALEDKRKQDPAFATNGAAQLDFIYKNSPYAEPGYLRYPVFRVE